MDSKYGEALSAFFDGEPIDAELLAESLAQPGASELLAEFAVMRARVRQDTCRPSAEFLEAMAERLAGSRLQRLLRGGLARIALAASLVVAVGVAGFMLGSVSGPERVPPVESVELRPATPRGPVAVLPAPQIAPPAAVVARPPGPRRPAESAGPPVPSLRLRFGQWRDTSPAVAEEEGRR